MSNKYRQLTVGAVGLGVASLGVLFRFVLVNPWCFKYLSLISTFGRDGSGNWNSPSVEIPYRVLSTVFMAFFFAGLGLMVAAVLAWLLIPEGKDDHAA